MPHQLRRIIGINIRNPKDGLPSGRIVSMDPRGGVLAIGVNGVGKTTFLRLLPLFYGATVQQIMRGTGHSKMVAHVLPDASSAIAFEYERETAQDLRTVVVYCRPNEDAPDFYIVMGGYREEYFYNEQREFVTRDEFKGRVEAMDVAVTRRLALHQYRSVILSENLPTKEGRELRSLSALHSLGPKPMRHLDQIAAAMANEKISFRDLQSIVIDRVSDADAGGAEVSQRTLKKNKGDVVSWLDNYKHLSKVMRLEPKARELAQRVTTIRGHHLALCGLHIAVKEAYRQTESLLVEKNERLRELDREIASRGEALDQAVSTLTDQHTETSRFHSDKNREVEEAEGTLAFFTKLGIEKLIAEEDAEGSIKQDQAAASSELAPLEAQAGSLRDSLRQRTEEARSAHIKHREGIDQRLVDASAEERAQHTQLSSARCATQPKPPLRRLPGCRKSA